MRTVLRPDYMLDYPDRIKKAFELCEEDGYNMHDVFDSFIKSDYSKAVSGRNFKLQYQPSKQMAISISAGLQKRTEDNPLNQIPTAASLYLEAGRRLNVTVADILKVLPLDDALGLIRNPYGWNYLMFIDNFIAEYNNRVSTELIDK